MQIWSMLDLLDAWDLSIPVAVLQGVRFLQVTNMGRCVNEHLLDTVHKYMGTGF